MRWIFILKCLLFSFCTTAQETSEWILRCDSTNLQQCGYVSTNNEVKIPFGRYTKCYTPIFKDIAIVRIDSTVYCINKKEQVLFEVFCPKNNPDHPSEGLFRIVRDNKIGYANLKGEVIIPPKYDAALPFNSGMAFINVGCEIDDVQKPTFWKGGKWGAINKEGSIVVPIKYSNMNFLSNTGEETQTSTQ